MESKSILVEYIDKVAIVKLNVPKKMNAMTFEMFIELEKIFESFQKGDKDIRAIILTGEGKHFTAGLDLTSAMTIGTIGG
jgi:enoyl-CoA hydratase/carnithine racemase